MTSFVWTEKKVSGRSRSHFDLQSNVLGCRATFAPTPRTLPEMPIRNGSLMGLAHLAILTVLLRRHLFDALFL